MKKLSLESQEGYLDFRYKGRKMVALSNTQHDRMRIITAITSYSILAPVIKDALMQANFHTALDARYAVSDDVLYAAFIHPLSTLCVTDLESALEQVYSLAHTFGKSYSSAQIAFTQKK